MYFINYSLIQRDSCILQIMQGRCASSVLWRENIGQTCIMSLQFLIFPTNKLDKSHFAINFDAFSTWKNRSLNLVSWFQRLLTYPHGG